MTEINWRREIAVKRDIVADINREIASKSDNIVSYLYESAKSVFVSPPEAINTWRKAREYLFNNRESIEILKKLADRYTTFDDESPHDFVELRTLYYLQCIKEIPWFTTYLDMTDEDISIYKSLLGYGGLITEYFNKKCTNESKSRNLISMNFRTSDQVADSLLKLCLDEHIFLWVKPPGNSHVRTNLFPTPILFKNISEQGAINGTPSSGDVYINSTFPNGVLPIEVKLESRSWSLTNGIKLGDTYLHRMEAEPFFNFTITTAEFCDYNLLAKFHSLLERASRGQQFNAVVRLASEVALPIDSTLDSSIERRASITDIESEPPAIPDELSTGYRLPATLASHKDLTSRSHTISSPSDYLTPVRRVAFEAIKTPVPKRIMIATESTPHLTSIGIKKPTVINEGDLLSQPVITKFTRKAQIPRVSIEVKTKLSPLMEQVTRRMWKKALSHCIKAKRKTVTREDLEYAFNDAQKHTAKRKITGRCTLWDQKNCVFVPPTRFKRLLLSYSLIDSRFGKTTSLELQVVVEDLISKVLVNAKRHMVKAKRTVCLLADLNAGYKDL